MADVCRATIGETAFLFYDQYVAKCAEQGIKFSWHQDGGYLGFPHAPYVTVWAAVDDMTEENGTATVIADTSFVLCCQFRGSRKCCHAANSCRCGGIGAVPTEVHSRFLHVRLSVRR